MRSLIIVSALSLAAPAAAQEAGLPPAALPAPDGNVAAMLAPVNALFAGLAAHDPAMIAPHLLDGATITVADSRADGSHTLRRAPFAEWLARLPSETAQFDERMPNPVVDTDGDVAMVWGFYRFYEDGAFTHCGADHFSLVREEGAWKIADLAFSTRVTDCGE